MSASHLTDKTEGIMWKPPNLPTTHLQVSALVAFSPVVIVHYVHLCAIFSSLPFIAAAPGCCGILISLRPHSTNTMARRPSNGNDSPYTCPSQFLVVLQLDFTGSYHPPPPLSLPTPNTRWEGKKARKKRGCHYQTTSC